MSKRSDKEPPKDRGIRLLEDAKQKVWRAVTHPLVPGFAADVLRPCTPGVRLVTDEEYIKTSLAFSQEPVTPLNLVRLREAAKQGTAITIRHHPTDGLPAILVKKNYVERNPNAPSGLPGLLAEEYAHALAQERRIPLGDIPDSSDALLPFRTREEVLHSLNERRQRFHPSDDIFTQQDITTVAVGFKTQFQDPKGTFYSGDLIQTVFEETRAAIIQTIFETIMRGRELSQRLSPQLQFTLGRSQLLFMKGDDAFAYIDHCVGETGNMQDGLTHIFEDLYYQTMDEFHKSRTEDQLNAFKETFNYVQLELIRRAQLPR